jgi:hypothetical protein
MSTVRLATNIAQRRQFLFEYDFETLHDNKQIQRSKGKMKRSISFIEQESFDKNVHCQTKKNKQ